MARKPVKRTVRAFLEILEGKKSTIYQLVPVTPHPNVATRAWRLIKPINRDIDREDVPKQRFYDIAVSTEGYQSCTCKGFTLGRTKCKHLRAAFAMGLLPAFKTN